MSVLGPGPEVEYLVELVAYDPALPGERTLRYSTLGKTTGPAETPANTFYDGVLVEPGDLARAIAAEGAIFGRAKASLGDVVLLNKDGALDGLADYAFDGRTLTIRRGAPGAAYPAGYPVQHVATMDDVEVTREAVRVRVRDGVQALDAPLQTTKYDGDNALPDGLEGVEGDLKGKPKPLVFGTVTNIAPPCVNTAKLIYQVNDGAVERVTDVYDKGLSLTGLPVGWSTVAHGVAGDLDLRGAARSGDTIIAIGFDAVAGDTIALVSLDKGATWTNYTVAAASGVGSANWVTFGEGVWACGSGSTCYTSADVGQTWTSRGTAGSADGIYAPVNGIFVSVAPSGALMYTSPDGVTAWTSHATGTGATPLRGICELPSGRLVIVGDAGTIITSDDGGSTWTPRTCPVTTALHAVAAGPNEVIAVGPSGGIVSSLNGTEWSSRNSGVTVSLNAPAYGRGRWVVGGNFNGFPSSENGGVLWSRPDDTVPAGTYYTLIDIDDGWLAIGDNVLARSHEVEEYASEADLLDDDLAPPPGTWAVYLAGGLIRLGSPPAGLITVDATQGATAADRTAGSLFENVLTKAGYTSADWSTADVTALDSADNSELGLFVGDEMTVAEALDLIAASVGAWWGVGADGLFRIVQFTAPSGTAALAIAEADILAIERLPSERPTYSTVLRYARNHVVQASDVAFGVTDARRAALAKEWREVTSDDATVQTTHLLARQVREDTLYTVAADAEAEADRRQALRGVKRDRFAVTVALDADTEALDLGQVVEVTHARFGLSAGRDFRITALDTMRADRRLRLTLWG